MRLLLLLSLAVLPAEAAVLHVLAYDLSGQTESVRNELRQTVVRVFGEAGIPVDWTTGDSSSPDARVTEWTRPEDCHLPSVWTGTLSVRLLTQAPPGLSEAALGQSLPCAHIGVHVTVYADRVAQVSRRLPTSSGLLLGYALIHEIGHVLLPLQPHSSRGVMKAVWNDNDLRRAAFYRLCFEPAEAAQMKRRLAGTESDSETTGSVPAGAIPSGGKPLEL